MPAVPGGGAVRRLAVDGLIAGLTGFFLYRSLWLPLSVLDRFDADFRNYYDAAVRLLAGLSPYDVKGFDYPPLTALIALPVAWLPYPQARVVWLVANWLCLAAAGVLMVRILGSDRKAVLAVAACWALCGTVAENLVLGQVNPILLLLVVLAWWGASRGRGGVAAVAIGLATALKLWPGVLLIALAALHWRRAAAGLVAALAFVALSWLPFLALPPPHSPARADYWIGTPALLNFSLPAVALRLADPPAPGQILPSSWRNGNDPLAFKLPARQGALSAGLAGLLLALGGAVLLWAERGASGEEGLAAMAAAVSLALLASPISWYHYQLLQLPGLALLARRWARSRPARLPGLAMLAAGLTWTHAAGIGRYVDRFGWTDSAPAWLWLASSLVPALALVHFALQVREMRGPV
ncbi:MAG TPA: glycosyltransferase family 87 protein [Thermoanaerobaculia bacterium]|nr:glycosyltransferase family 87 protein [Thermoanaerobaculia bacterium]